MKDFCVIVEWHFDVGTSYFPHRRTREYHGIGALSLLCSEWEEVGHARMKHRHQKAAQYVLHTFQDRGSFYCLEKCVAHTYAFCVDNFYFMNARTLFRAKVSIGMVGGLLVLLG